MASFSLRHYIDLIEAVQTPWGVSRTPIFADSLLQHMKVFPDLNEKLIKFLEVKLSNPFSNKYGKHDSPFSGPLVGFFHCHLRDDAILIYNLQNRCINLVMIVSHAEIEGKRMKKVVKQIQPFKS